MNTRNDVPVIDAHHHLWELREGTYDWLTVEPPPQLLTGDFRAIRRDYRIADYLADIGNHGVVRSVHVEAGLDARDPGVETRRLQKIADEYGYPHAIVAYAELEDPNVEQVLAAHAEFPNVRGIRQMVSWHLDPILSQCERDDYLTDPAWQRGFALLQRYGLVFDLQVYPAQMADAAALAARHLSTQLVLEHAGMPVEKEPKAQHQWRAGMRLLAAEPNVTVKLSGIGMTDHHWTIDSMRILVREIIETFGPDRCMFGSNFPVDSLYADYGRLINAFHTVIAELSPGAQADVLHGTAARVYNLAL